MPKAVVEDHGLERTDFGKLGSGIYFSDSVSASIKYISPSEMEGTQLLAVYDVALGSFLDLYEQDYSLNNAPSAYDSVHGVCKSADISSDVEDDEFVVYKSCQVKIRYVVKFCLAEDQIKPFQPAIGMEMEQDNYEPVTMLFTAREQEITAREHNYQQQLQLLLCQCVSREARDALLHKSSDDYALPNADLSNPLRTGLQDRLGNPVPLQGVYIKATDFVAQVVMFQTYTNQNSKPIEAKYVFPLDDRSAVSGFEAFINGKDVTGECPESLAYPYLSLLHGMALGISVHSWEKILKCGVDHLINNFLIRKGIQSLGPDGKATAVDGCSCAAVHTLHKEIERDSFQNTDKTG